LGWEELPDIGKEGDLLAVERKKKGCKVKLTDPLEV
jgi:hypothetical protein